MKNKSIIWIYPLAILGVLVMLSSSCKKKDSSSNPAPTTVTDIDGNIYHTVAIGTQVWMVENLNVTHYRNGDPIAHVSDDVQWSNLTTGAYRNYNNNGANASTYGRLYNWYAINDGTFIAPSGWHLPSDAEWTTLSDYLGGETVAGGKLKEAGLEHWNTPNTGGTNTSGFTALGAGWCDDGGFFSDFHDYEYWWSSTESSSGNAQYRNVAYDYTDLNNNNRNKKSGLSVRCIKD